MCIIFDLHVFFEHFLGVSVNQWSFWCDLIVFVLFLGVDRTSCPYEGGLDIHKFVEFCLVYSLMSDSILKVILTL